MTIHIKGAREHNLKGVDIAFSDGLTVVTGVSGSGKTSLVFDTLYHEARRRFLEIYSLGSAGLRLSPANVDSISGLGPAVAVGQNLLNRNPNSTLASASGLHPFLRLFYANYGNRYCSKCSTALQVLSDDEIIEEIIRHSGKRPITVFAELLQEAFGSHQTLLRLLMKEFGTERLYVDGSQWHPHELDPSLPHTIEVLVENRQSHLSAKRARDLLNTIAALGASSLSIQADSRRILLSRAPACVRCGTWFGELTPQLFHSPCSSCTGEGCGRCDHTGLHPDAAAVLWHGKRFPDMLALPVNQARELFEDAEIPSSALRIKSEITRRLEALQRVGLGYITLDRPSPTISRGEAQRVRLAVTLTNRLEDMLHVLDEPTIGQHPSDLSRLLPAFRELGGPVVFVEHDRLAASAADFAIDLGPGAGVHGGQVLYNGSPARLWEADTPTGRYFSLRDRVQLPENRPEAEQFLVIHGADLRNLQSIDVPIPLRRLTIITGVSGSGKSTFVEDVLVASLKEGKPVGCSSVEGPPIKPILVDQSPIGRNPRSNPATYTKLADFIRDIFAQATGYSASHFSFNRPEGACPTCKGIGAVEVRMRYLPSTWIPCSDCDGLRFSEDVLKLQVPFGEHNLSIADFYRLSVSEFIQLLNEDDNYSVKDRKPPVRILNALKDIGLGYLPLGQPSPTLSGGEAQRVKLARHLGKGSLSNRLLVLDEPSTGLHPQDLSGLLIVLDRLVRSGATIVVVEHNTDVIRAADWIIDLGPGAGPQGGQVLYSGVLSGLEKIEKSPTCRAIKEELTLHPSDKLIEDKPHRSPVIAIKDARANNLKNISVDFPKGKLTVVTGVSGSGKSSLVVDVLEAEARRRFLETLSLYERQSTREGPEAPVGDISGLGVAITISPERRLYERRATVGSASEISHHLAVLFASLGECECPHCSVSMNRGLEFRCSSCGYRQAIPKPRHFRPRNYAAACQTCHGVGSMQIPNPDKLIVHPEKPLCDGAMYSPGFFPKGYLCKPYNHGYYLIRAIAARYGFDPQSTPWELISPEGQNAFLFGDPEPLQVTAESRTRGPHTYKAVHPGFYGWVRDWDVGGTYTDTKACPECHGARLRPEFLAITIDGYNVHQMCEMTLGELKQVLDRYSSLKYPWRTKKEWREVNNRDLKEGGVVASSLETAQKRLRFLVQVGLDYLTLNRISASLSAGEAQRVKLAGIIGSGLRSLTVLLDEPSRGMHPSEVDALVGVLYSLRNEGNTVIVVEHDPGIIRAADYLIDVGPGAGVLGGEVVAQGSPRQVSRADTLTGGWLRGERYDITPKARRKPRGWLSIHGARANNLQGVDVRLPLGVMLGVCGVSGSGKSTLILDTVGRALAPKKHTTSVAREPIEPGTHDGITGEPKRIVIVDQTKAGVTSPLSYLNLMSPIRKLYAASPDAIALGLTEKDLSAKCSACLGRGHKTIDMGFLPSVHVLCETCQGSGQKPEAWQVRLKDISMPELYALSLDEVYEIFGEEDSLEPSLRLVREVGLGYLALRQPGYSLSGGETQRLKIAKELKRRTKVQTLYILDEPTVGQHMEDVSRLTRVLENLVDAGHSVWVIEHHIHLLASCDWLIELGPGGGPDGGQVIASGPPEELAQRESPTGKFIHGILDTNPIDDWERDSK
jgi:excinuclease ABC subunit A